MSAIPYAKCEPVSYIPWHTKISLYTYITNAIREIFMQQTKWCRLSHWVGFLFGSGARFLEYAMYFDSERMRNCFNLYHHHMWKSRNSLKDNRLVTLIAVFQHTFFMTSGVCPTAT